MPKSNQRQRAAQSLEGYPSSSTTLLPWSAVVVAAKIYVVLALAAGAVLTSSFYSWVAIGLLPLEIYFISRPHRYDLSLLLSLGILLLLPLLFESLLPSIAASLLLVPALPLLDSNLKQHCQGEIPYFSKGIRPTATGKALAGVLAAMFGIAIIAWNLTLAMATGIIASFFLGILIYLFTKVGKAPLDASEIGIRVIVGETAEVQADIKSKGSVPLKLHMSTIYSWAHVTPDHLTIEERVQVGLAVTPPLSGPAQLPIQVTATDPWGLVFMGQDIGPVELSVIPKAKYAQWLAKKYLAETMPSTVTSAGSLHQEGGHKGGGGLEFYGCRQYRPGDRMSDINWKHVIKLRDLVVNEYSKGGEQRGILAANLAATNAEEADLLAYTLVTSALTMARNALPAAVVAYDGENVLSATKLLTPREIVKKALALTEKMALVEPIERFLHPQEIGSLNSTITQLNNVDTQPAQRLCNMLRMEYTAMERTALEHPLSVALSQTISHVRPPATITLVSLLNHDMDATSVLVEKLMHSGYRILQIPIIPRT